jgi:di/tricarboxylate transporter
MTLEIGLLFGLLSAMAVLFLTEKLPIEITAFLGLLALVLGGFVSPAEAFTGFASPAVITMLSVFFLSAALLHTGVADLIGGRVHRLIGNREIPLIVAIMLVAGLLSAFMNNIAAVAVLLPAVASIARKTGAPPARLFMPLAFGAILGGTTTMVGTPPNILAGDLLRERGLEPFSLFDFTPLGTILLAVGILYMITLGRWLMPTRQLESTGEFGGEELAGIYDLRESLFSIRVPRNSTMVGSTLGESRFGSALDVQVVGIERHGRTHLAPSSDTVIEGDDRLIVDGQYEQVRNLSLVQGVEIGDLTQDMLMPGRGGRGLVAARVVGESTLVGHTLRDLEFQQLFRAIVVGIRRDDALVDGDLAAQTLRGGDLIVGLVPRDDRETWAPPEGLEREDVGPDLVRDLRDTMFQLRVPAG